MRRAQTLKSIEIQGFKSFGRKGELIFTSPIAAIVGPNGSGKSNVAEAFRFVLGEQSMKSMRTKRGEDLIWGGAPTLARGNRASVKVVFDNSQRILDVDFSEVTIERTVYRDGQNEYTLNGATVRLKDLMRLLAGAHVGGSGYQIISQGEADRILTASSRERRTMVEDALGLKLYQHKKAESERKLEETAKNIETTHSLRRELVPHLKFLKQQVDKIQKAHELRTQLAIHMNEYLAREHAYIHAQEQAIQAHYDSKEAESVTLRAALEHARTLLSPTHTTSYDPAVAQLEREIADVRSQILALQRDLGRAEGARGALQTATPVREHTITLERTALEDIITTIQGIETYEDIPLIRATLHKVTDRLRDFVQTTDSGMVQVDTRELDETIAHIQQSIAQLQARESTTCKSLEIQRSQREKMHAESAQAQRNVYVLESQYERVITAMDQAKNDSALIQTLKERFEEEVREGIVLVGADIHNWSGYSVDGDVLAEDRAVQDRRHRDMERLKVKIEEAGLGNSDEVLREYTQTQARDEFLSKELSDLETSRLSLIQLIEDLTVTIDSEFHTGLVKINEALQTFFEQLFGGGTAKLSVERVATRESQDTDILDTEQETTEEKLPGLTVSVSLPRKKVSGLEVLSGGERALTSIALIFAMSQVNPPPFLILDETDAALDEANSKRYADMIKVLGERSQLIVITHNRATMGAAGELYGVTMTGDGVSKLLSVKLDEAVRVAK